MEHLNNLPPFYVGQKVVYIKNIALLENSIHIVRSIRPWPCGCFDVFVDAYNFTAHSNWSGRVRCPDHDWCMLPGSCGIDSKSFRPVLQEKAPLIKLIKVIEEQPVIAN